MRATCKLPASTCLVSLDNPFNQPEETLCRSISQSAPSEDCLISPKSSEFPIRAIDSQRQVKMVPGESVKR